MTQWITSRIAVNSIIARFSVIIPIQLIILFLILNYSF